MLFALFVALGFGTFALFSLALAIDYRGWGTRQVQAGLNSRLHRWMLPPSWKSNAADPQLILKRYVRWFDLAVFVSGTFGCLYLISQVV